MGKKKKEKSKSKDKEKKLLKEQEKVSKKYDSEKYEKPSVTADVVVFTVDEDNDLNILLVKRKNYPFKDCWAIPGGFLEANKESIEETAARELYEETGIRISDGIDLRQLITLGNPDRDPRTHVVSVIYTALIPKGMLKIKAGDDAQDAKLFKLSFNDDGIHYVADDIMVLDEELAFDHNFIINTAVERLRGRLNYTTDAFSLLKDKSNFTVYELQKIHETIGNTSLDRSNFRKMFIREFINTGKVEKTAVQKFAGKPETSVYSCNF